MTRAQMYQVPRAAAPCDLFLDGNEGRTPVSLDLRSAALQGLSTLSRYPNDTELREILACQWQLDVACVMVTAGADDALDRICRTMFRQGGELLFPTPGFGMVPRYAQMSGGHVVAVPWTTSFPCAALMGACTERTRVIVVTSPNNPTGAVCSAEQLRQLRRGTGDALLVVDLAYAEFADEDLTEAALQLPNTLVLRTVSKAWGLAGLRVGYAMGSPSWIRRLRGVGAPYAVSSLSLSLAQVALNTGRTSMDDFVSRIRIERSELVDHLNELGLAARPSQGNFVYAETDNPIWIRDALAGLGIAIRAFPEREGLAHAIRITCPGDTASFQRLRRALSVVCAPQALCLDIDGVLCDVRESYWACIERTAVSFGVSVDRTDIERIKGQGNANNDWRVTQRLCAEAGVELPLAVIKDRFEEMLQGSGGQQGLWMKEKPLVSPKELDTLAQGKPLAIVTGRPRKDAVRFLSRAGLLDRFDRLVCLEDAPLKPDPRPIQNAMTGLGISRAWMLGDTPDDIQSARKAGALPIGVIPPGASRTECVSVLVQSGAARVFDAVGDVAEVLS